MNNKNYSSDFLVMGSGIAGLCFAIEASREGTVNIVTKKREFDSNTNYAQGGIASVLDPSDTFEGHINDTITAGAYLCNRKAVDALVHEGPDSIKELIEWGARFSYESASDGSKTLELGREGGHSRNRIVHASDLTRREVERALLAKIKEIPGIKIFENHSAVDLLTEHQLTKTTHGENCYGAYVLDNSTGDIHTFTAKITMIASGGAGSVYLHSTNPSIATGDGIAIAYRAGALVADMEFMQFHPTALYQKTKEGRSFLISEAVRGEGAILRNVKGERFMENLHPLKELAPRDIVARAIDRELKKSGEKFVYLDISFKGRDFLEKRFPQIFNHCLEQGIDISKDAIPVVPVAHFLCGGIVTDLNGHTSIGSLYAAGEAACTGVHGANRLASNSLLEALVFGRRAAHHAGAQLCRSICVETPEFPVWDKEGTFDLEEWILISHNIEEIKRLMWDYVGIVRTNLRLKRAYGRILFLKDEIRDYYRRSTVTTGLLELRNMSTVSRLIISGAMMRKESRGLHYNTDYPDLSDDMKVNIIQRNGAEPYLADIATFSFSSADGCDAKK
jgi:L-aspartate oxidase